MALTKRTSTDRERVSPTRRTFFSSRTRRSFDWRRSGRSPISSRKNVPPEASSTSPTLSRTAPVKEPRAWPKSSLSRSASGMAAQLTATNGPPRRAPRLMDGLRGQLLSRAALAGDEDRGVRVADLLDHGPDAPDRRGLAQEGPGAGSVRRRAGRRPPGPRRRSLLQEIDDGRHGQGQELQVVRYRRAGRPRCGPGRRCRPGGRARSRDRTARSGGGARSRRSRGRRRAAPGGGPGRGPDGRSRGPGRPGLRRPLRRGVRTRRGRDAPGGLEDRVPFRVESPKDGLVRGDVVEDDLGDPGKQLAGHCLFI